MKEYYGEKQSNQIDVSIVIVNWNTKDLLKNCLDSVYQTINNLTFEIIVVDNASSDGSREMLARDYPQIIRICNQGNKGFGAANNQAFAVMKGKYALLLNTDALLTPNAVNQLWTFCEANSQAAIVCGQLLNSDGSKQNSIASFPGLLMLATNTSLLEYLFPEKFPSKRYKHEKPVAVDSAIGACMLIRKKALDNAGVFDERYFFFFEETDLAYAMHRAGWKTYHIPDAYIYHLQGQSIGDNVRSRIEFYRSRYQFLNKWHSRKYYYLASGIIFMRLLINWISGGIAGIATLGMVKKIRQKFIVYSRLILWHLKRDKQQS
jgi:GT2 family glycosyltransferase